ncbi:MAG: hypothetical protein QOH26_726, partial [Actinomycetota bacterium]|nr:hypothetical protein [Actinomycetota bacterium]
RNVGDGNADDLDGGRDDDTCEANENDETAHCEAFVTEKGRVRSHPRGQ